MFFVTNSFFIRTRDMKKRKGIMYNPFDEVSDPVDTDKHLIKSALNGDRLSLEKLILRHQAWIYNIAFKMTMDHDDACDVTQEILVKIITNLSSYNSEKAQFRTWLYRIVINHILSMKRKKFELRINDFDRYADLIENLPDNQVDNNPESELMEQELKVGCMMGMLMCLNRSDRIAFLLGAIFSVKDNLGAELMNIKRESFRQKLSRSRKKIFSHMNQICGHVNPENECRCKNKYEYFVNKGMINSDVLRFHKPNTKQIKEVIENRLNRFTDSYYDPFVTHFQEQPFYDSPDMSQWFRKMMRQEDFKEIFNIH